LSVAGSKELKFQVELTEIQNRASALYGFLIALIATGMGVLIGALYLSEQPQSTTAAVLAAMLIGGGYIGFRLVERSIERDLEAKRIEAENWKD
jgi:hypothetical protein